MVHDISWAGLGLADMRNLLGWLRPGWLEIA